MRLLIMGSGAVGSAYGALLAQHGHEVTFVAPNPWPVTPAAPG